MAEKTPNQTMVEELVALHPVVIFSKTTCPFAAKAKEAFKSIGISRPAVVELDKLDLDIANEIQDHLLNLTGARTVPRVFVGHKFLGGGTKTQQLAESGDLKALTDKAVFEHGKDLDGADVSKLAKSDEDWRKDLDPTLFRILRQRGTERPGSHEYDQFYPEVGYFTCAGCALPLYSASSKFKSSCGWPVFDRCYHSEEFGSHVACRSDGSGCLEIYCPKCGGHLGHVFFDAVTKQNPNGERH
jgi:peptide-methionine (R)-S-oxide reductase